MTKGPSWSEKKNNGRDLNSVWPINSNEKSLSSTISWTSPATRVDASSRLNFFTWVQLEVSCEHRLCRVTGNGNLLLPAMLQADECLQQGWFKGMWTFYSTCSSDTEPLSKKKKVCFIHTGRKLLQSLNKMRHQLPVVKFTAVFLSLKVIHAQWSNLCFVDGQMCLLHDRHLLD